jgi:hypothetical protein
MLVKRHKGVHKAILDYKRAKHPKCFIFAHPDHKHLQKIYHALHISNVRSQMYKSIETTFYISYHFLRVFSIKQHIQSVKIHCNDVELRLIRGGYPL